MEKSGLSPPTMGRVINSHHLLLCAAHYRTVLRRRYRDECRKPRSTSALLIDYAERGLSGAAVAFGGAINFIGLMAPHISRKLVGPSFGALIPVSALTGSYFCC